MASPGLRKGRLDVPISRTGRLQADAVGGLLPGRGPFDLIATSPLVRARTTAEIALKAARLVNPVKVEPLLAERGMGMFDGRPLREFNRWERNTGGIVPPPGGESRDDFARRVDKWLRRVCRSGFRRVLAFTHGGVICRIVEELNASLHGCTRPAANWCAPGVVIRIAIRARGVAASSTVPRVEEHPGVVEPWFCNVCGSMGPFLACRGRPLARCSSCGCLERHRHQLWVTQTTHLLKRLAGGQALCLAPEAGIATRLAAELQLVSMDLDPRRRPGMDVCGDARRMPFREHAFDLVWASHVLEHIPEVDTAIREIHRVLRPGGFAMFDVPIVALRTRRLLQPDELGHVWAPGWDWMDRYRQAGFLCSQYDWSMVPAKLGVPERASVVLARKP